MDTGMDSALALAERACLEEGVLKLLPLVLAPYRSGFTIPIRARFGPGLRAPIGQVNWEGFCVLGGEHSWAWEADLVENTALPLS